MEKLYKNLLIIDGSYLLHRSLKVPDLWELRSNRGKRTGGIYGFLNSLSYLTRQFPSYYPVVAWDQGRSPRRLDIYPKYKGEHLLNAEKASKKMTLDQFETELENSSYDSDTITEMKTAFASALNENRIPKSPDDDYVTQFITQKNDLLYLLETLGVPSIIKRGWEGDDIITLLARISTDSYVVTDDKDMIQLIRPDLKIARPLAKEVLEFNQYTVENDIQDIREVVLIKAIVGDPSDSIPSVTSGLEERKYRVGGVRAKKIAKILLDNNEDIEKSKPRILEEVKNPGIGFLKCYDNYERNLKLVDLSLVPDDVDTYNLINYCIDNRIARRNMINFISEFSQYDISSIDYQMMFGSLNSISNNILI